MSSSIIKKLRKKLDLKKISSVELTEEYIKKIKKLNPKLNAIITLCEEKAKTQAKKADKIIREGRQGDLTGIPIIHKDNICTADILTTCGSKILENFKPPYNSFIVRRLEEAGMIMLGKSNMDEFGMGSTNETSYYGAVKNPHNISFVPGGSSGGSAASIASDMAPVATGTDTGGSIRQPASFCGITGIKPSYGCVSRFGLIAYGSSFDQIGTLSKSIDDSVIVLNKISGVDTQDSNSIRIEKNFFDKLNKDCKLTIGIDHNLLDKLDPKPQKLLMDSAKVLENQGHKLKKISLLNLELSVSIYYILASAEAASNLSRFDGIRFGYRNENAESLEELYVKTRTEGFGEEVKRRIVMGNYVLAANQYNTYYKKAQKIRQKIYEDFEKIYSGVDAILLPVTPGKAFKLNYKRDTVSQYLDDMYTVIANLIGSPSISFPIGKVDGMPFGAQIMTRIYEDYKAVKIVREFQNNTEHHL